MKAEAENKTVFAGPAIAYVAGALALVPLYSRQIDADGISYISIAAKYLAGDYLGAVNGYWGPMLSWLLAPLMASGLNPLLAVKILGAGAGLLALYGVYRLSLIYEMHGKLRTTLLYAMLPVLYSFFLVVISPDLLVAALLLLYYSLLSEDDYLAGKKPYFCGALAAAAYFSKSYAMPFFLAHFTLVHAYRFFSVEDRSSRKRLVSAFLKGVLVFAFLCAPWVGFLSGKYGRLTVNTTGTYNHAVMGPGYPWHPINFKGFYAPPNVTALSVWEDPSYIPVESWNPLGSWQLFRHQLSLLLRNSFAVSDACQSVTYFSFAVILLFLLFCCGGASAPPLPKEKWFLPLATLVLYAAGYMPIVVRARYLYFCYLLLYVMGAAALWQVVKGGFLTPRGRRIAVAAFLLSLWVAPLANLIGNFGQGRDILPLARRLAASVPVRGENIASNTYWMETLYLSYYTGARYYGQARRGATPVELRGELEQQGIKYFLVWDDSTLSLPCWKELPPFGIANLRVLECASCAATPNLKGAR